MKGTIRFVGGLMITWIALGSMDAATDTGLIILVALAAAGLYAMYSGSQALKDQ
jgi:hypothetical protein